VSRARLSRRSLLAASAASAASLAACVPVRSAPELREQSSALRKDPDGLLDLPEGFGYRVLQRAGATMSDGHRMPGRPDAMACFDGEDGTWVLMRNHELWEAHPDLVAWQPGQSPAQEAYDAIAPGGVTRMVLDARTSKVVSSNLVLAGTFWNCAGGVSPWGWLSCEETVQVDHGYVFLCEVDAERVRPPRRIDGYGRFRHEAAAVDPRTSIAYLTEDEFDACFYRFVPVDPDAPFEGTLQALVVQGRPRLDTGLLERGRRLAIDWVDLPDLDPELDTPRIRAQALGAATFRRTEGLWLDGDDAFMSATNGGRSGRGQILRLDLSAQTLEVFASPDDPSELDMPDNLTVSPDGLLFVAEDGIDGDNYLRVIDREGAVLAFAHSRKPTEFAGPCFAPDGQTLFVNLQALGLTLAIDGPFDDVLGLSSQPVSRRHDGRRAAITGVPQGLAALAASTWMRRARVARRRRSPST
jgi:secreted PhoX family phosphatase